MYILTCKDHGRQKAGNIVDLITEHTDKTFGALGGNLVCPQCQGPAVIKVSSKLQERHDNGKQWIWQRTIKAVVRIPTDVPTYSPYFFITSSRGSEPSEVGDGIHLNYYKDCRPKGKLKHGHGPGGAPVFGADELLTVVERAARLGMIPKRKIEALVRRLDEDQSRIQSSNSPQC